MDDPLYYEAHITVGINERDYLFQRIARDHGFRISYFNNSKDYEHEKEWIFTAKSFILAKLRKQCEAIQEALKQEQFKVVRYKIEATVFDTKPLSHHKGFLEGDKNGPDRPTRADEQGT